MELRNTPAKDLDKFIKEYLQPDTSFREQVKRAIHIICSFLKERCFQGGSHPVQVSKVVKGGSSGKGTALRGRSDADLVVFLSPLRSFQDQLTNRGEFIKEIRKQLEACQREKTFDVKFEVQNPRWSNPRVLSFVLYSPQLQEGVEFDVLPAFDALGQWTEGSRPDPEIYIKLIQECTSPPREGEFSTCFTELQRDFLRRRPAKLKSLIRLVKHWYQMCKEKLEKPLPQKYALELLTVYAWEQGSREPGFVTAQGFQTVLILVKNYQQLCIYWTSYYDFKTPEIGEYLKRQLKKPRPVILDPADPTGNVGGGDPEGWRRLAREAETWLSFPCFKNWDGSSVGSWSVPEADSEVEFNVRDVLGESIGINPHGKKGGKQEKVQGEMNRNAANASFGAGMAFTAVLQQQTEVAKPLNPRVDQSLKSLITHPESSPQEDENWTCTIF